MATDSLSWNSAFALRITPKPTTGIYWASAASPRHGPCVFAIAGSNGTVLLHEREENWRSERRPPPEGLRKVVAVDWLGPNVILKGCQNGAVRLWDLRSGAASREPRLQHPSAINYVRSIDQNFLIVAGLQNEVNDIPYAQCAFELTF